MSQSINKNDKFVACWGYDQTQYSIYNVVEVKGKSVLVEGLNGWSNLDANDLAAGSKVKVYQKRNERFHALTEEERQAVADELHFSLRPNDFVDDVITAHHDPEYDRNQRRYAEQNEYTAYNGR